MGILSSMFGSKTKEAEKPKPKPKTKPASEEEKIEKEREWQDIEEPFRFVCHGGKAECKYCSTPADIIVTSNTISLQDKYWATVADKDGKVNLDFKGVCNHPSQQKPLCPPPPCKAVIQLSEWKNYSNTHINDDYALLVQSTIPCMISGEDIKIIDSGQISEVEELELNLCKRITSTYWLDEDCRKRLREVMTGEYADLVLRTIGFEEGEEIKVTIRDTEGQELKEATKEVVLIGKVNADDIVEFEEFFEFEDTNKGIL